MDRNAKTPSALIALARTRRLQRALAHAYLHRGAPMPTLRSSLGFMTATACVAHGPAQRVHRMRVLGVARAEGVAFVVEELGDEDDTPIVYRLFLRGPHQGHLVPLRAWYELADDVAELRARIAALTATLEPMRRSTPEAWMLSTRIVQRRALRITGPGASGDLPIRKFALQLLVEPVGGHGPSGKATVTAFLRPQAQLAEVWSLGGGDALARVSYTGLPSGPGLSKDTVVLLTSGLDAT
ncbi:MAG TPA: hypothetical protein VNO30_23260 [Kofleriaceae bacterium]|nr:hypothetical protein [Kofleriaceae bacterium]